MNTTGPVKILQPNNTSTASMSRKEGLRSQSVWVLDEISSPLRASYLQIKEEITHLIHSSRSCVNQSPGLLNEEEQHEQQQIPRFDSIENSLQNGTWDVFYYLEEGKVNPDFMALCPQTTAVLQKLPLLTDCSLGYCYVSILSPGAEITPHFGCTNLKLRIQLPLLHTSESVLTVDGVEHRYIDGEPIIFDDSFQHSVRNMSLTESRVVLLIDIWHPDLSLEAIHGILSRFPSSGVELPISLPTLGTVTTNESLTFPLQRLEDRLTVLRIDLRSVPASSPPPGAAASEYDFLFKMVLLGDPSAGKSSFLLRYMDDTFSSTFFTTIGVDFVCTIDRRPDLTLTFA
jgi:hypothetical protein